MNSKHATICYGTLGSTLAAYDQHSFDLVGNSTTITINSVLENGIPNLDSTQLLYKYITEVHKRPMEMTFLPGMYLVDIYDSGDDELCGMYVTLQCLHIVAESAFRLNSFGEMHFVLAYCGAMHAFLCKEGTDAVYTDIQRTLRLLPYHTVARISPYIDHINKKCEEFLSAKFGAYPALIVTADGSFRFMTVLTGTKHENVL